MEYAPVFIPTLNRYDHFKHCLESLEKCSGANLTDVYVALDYPPCEKYVEGWKQIDSFLHYKEQNNSFGQLIVIRRDHNCGILKDDSNINLLIKSVRQNYDRFILSEDDNVFSPNFLEYVNKGLERYKDDPSVFAVTGYTEPYPFLFADNSYFFHNTDFSAWGYGMWFDRSDTAEIDIRGGFFHNTFSLRNMRKMYKHGLNRLQQYVLFSFQDPNQIMLTDCALTCYMILNDMYVTVPSLSKVRNIGWDEFGQSFQQNKNLLVEKKEIAMRHMNQVIDDNKSFEYIGDPFSYFDDNNKIAALYTEARINLGTFINTTLRRVLRYYMNKIGLEGLMVRLKILKEK